MTDPIEHLKHLAETAPEFSSVAEKMLNIYCDYDTLADNTLLEAMKEIMSIYSSLVLTLDRRYGVEDSDRASIAHMQAVMFTGFFSQYVTDFGSLLSHATHFKRDDPL